MPGLKQTVSIGQLAEMAANGGLLPEVGALTRATGKALSEIMQSDLQGRPPAGTPLGAAAGQPLGLKRPAGETLAAGHDSNSAWVAAVPPAAALQPFGGAAVPTRSRKLASRPKRSGKGGPVTRPRQPGTLLQVDPIGHAPLPPQAFAGLSEKAAGQMDQVIVEAAARGWLVG